MLTGRVTPTMKPAILAIAVLTALTASFVMTGVAKALVFGMTAELTAEAEVPEPGPAGATGSALISIDDETNEVCFDLTIEGIADDDSVIAAHIHEGAAGVAGDVVVPLFTEPPTGEMTGCVQDVDASVIAAITADPDLHYVNIHTEQFPNGAVRGQLVVSGVGGECNITVSPSTISDGGKFTVSGDFGAGAEIHVVQGTDTSFPEDSDPIVTVPVDQASFNVTITMLAGSVGSWTVWGFIEGTECGDSAPLTVTAATLPNTATEPDNSPVIPVTGALLLVLGALAFRRLEIARIR